MNKDDHQTVSWDFPVVGEDNSRAKHYQRTHIKNELQTQKEQAAAQGKQEGMQVAQQQMQQLLNQCGEAVTLFQQPIQLINQQLLQQLLQMVVLVCQQVLRQELTTSPEKITDVIKNVINELPLIKQQSKLYLNPEDLTVLKQLMEQATVNFDINDVLEDNQLARGEVRLSNDVSEVDASCQTRIQHIIEKILQSEQLP